MLWAPTVTSHLPSRLATQQSLQVPVGKKLPAALRGRRTLGKESQGRQRSGGRSQHAQGVP